MRTDVRFGSQSDMQRTTYVRFTPKATSPHQVQWWRAAQADQEVRTCRGQRSSSSRSIAASVPQKIFGKAKERSANCGRDTAGTLAHWLIAKMLKMLALPRGLEPLFS